jgi:hypothetical protein
MKYKVATFSKQFPRNPIHDYAAKGVYNTSRLLTTPHLLRAINDVGILRLSGKL